MKSHLTKAFFTVALLSSAAVDVYGQPGEGQSSYRPSHRTTPSFYSALGEQGEECDLVQAQQNQLQQVMPAYSIEPTSHEQSGARLLFSPEIVNEGRSDGLFQQALYLNQNAVSYNDYGIFSMEDIPLHLGNLFMLGGRFIQALQVRSVMPHFASYAHLWTGPVFGNFRDFRGLTLEHTILYLGRAEQFPITHEQADGIYQNARARAEQNPDQMNLFRQLSRFPNFRERLNQEHQEELDQILQNTSEMGRFLNRIVDISFRGTGLIGRTTANLLHGSGSLWNFGGQALQAVGDGGATLMHTIGDGISSAFHFLGRNAHFLMEKGGNGLIGIGGRFTASSDQLKKKSILCQRRNRNGFGFVIASKEDDKNPQNQKEKTRPSRKGSSYDPNSESGSESESEKKNQ